MIVLAAGIFFSSRELQRLPDGKLHVYFLDVGQGDGALIVTPSGKQIVIDGGPAEGAMLSELSNHLPFFDRSIDMLVLSHPHLDHLFAFPDILRRYRVGRILMTGEQAALPRYQEFLGLIREQRIPILLADPDKDIDFGDGVTLDIVWPQPDLFGKTSDGNNTSVMLRILTGSGIVFFSGDAEKEEEIAALASGADMRATVLKVAHHGSKTSSETGFLLAVRPSLGIISAGKKNKFGHPNAVILDRFEALGVPLKVTSVEGMIEVRY
ncbi:MAG: MBL fold metallo-hydrolase [Candidatus Peribacteraceae bacterium]|nr:MBL fold metallo-hydrolase [Candidatus Peribacteraceae bacterium]